jgi:hypothetical protein
VCILYCDFTRYGAVEVRIIDARYNLFASLAKLTRHYECICEILIAKSLVYVFGKMTGEDIHYLFEAIIPKCMTWHFNGLSSAES